MLDKSNHKLDPSILREYDIRGIVDKTLSFKDAYFIGKAFATHLKNNYQTGTIAVARDGRLSSDNMRKQLIEGIISTGLNVIDIGLGPTPLLYFSCHHFNTIGGIMVTGSHNPPDYNGFKFVYNNKSFFGNDIKLLGQLIEQNELEQGAGQILDCDQQQIKEIYLEKLLSGYKGQKNLRMAWDPGNGAAGEIVEMLCAKLPGEHFIINSTIDGTFPSHHPDPTVHENLEQLIDLVKEQNCDVGVAFDGDADRIGVVDAQGRMIAGDMLVGIYASEIIKNYKNPTIIADVKSSQYLFDSLNKQGANAIMWKTGHSLIKTKMAETGAVLAGEMSGHIFFADHYYGFDDGIYAAIRLANLLSNQQQNLVEIVNQLPISFTTPELRIDCAEERKFVIIDEIKQRLEQANITYNDIDGIRCSTESGWWLIRASNTQAAIVARCEANSSSSLEQVKSLLKNQLTLSGINYEF